MLVVALQVLHEKIIFEVQKIDPPHLQILMIVLDIRAIDSLKTHILLIISMKTQMEFQSSLIKSLLNCKMLIHANYVERNSTKESHSVEDNIIVKDVEKVSAIHAHQVK